jgi:hypothetical protein
MQQVEILLDKQELVLAACPGRFSYKVGEIFAKILWYTVGRALLILLI